MDSNKNNSKNKDNKSIKYPNIKITLYNLFKLLNDSLYDLSNSFGISVTKGYFS